MSNLFCFVAVSLVLSATLSFRVSVPQRGFTLTHFGNKLEARHSKIYMQPDNERESGSSDEFEEILDEAAPDVENATQEGAEGEEESAGGEVVVGEGEGGKAKEEEEEEEEEKSPFEMAIEEKEKELKKQIEETEKLLRKERVANMRVADKMSESGKTGYFIVQAQVAEFLKKKEADQKVRVARNKREFIKKMLSVVDAFEAAPINAPSSTEKEKAMHETFGALRSSIDIVFQKYGVTNIVAVEGEQVDSSIHAVQEVVDGETNGIITSVLSTGYKDDEGLIIRKAGVVATQIPGSDPVQTEEEDDSEEDGDEGDEGDEGEEASGDDADSDDSETEGEE